MESANNNIGITIPILRCGICEENFIVNVRLPLILPCGHTICSDCMNRMTFCPFDRSKVDKLGVQINYYVLDLIDETKSHTDSNSDEPSDDATNDKSLGCVSYQCIRHRKNNKVHEDTDVLIECKKCLRKMYVPEDVYFGNKYLFNLVDYEPCTSDAHTFATTGGCNNKYNDVVCTKCFSKIKRVHHKNSSHPDMQPLEYF